MARAAIFLTLFVMLAICALTAESRGLGGRGRKAIGRGPRRLIVGSRQGVSSKGAPKKKRFIGIIFNLINKVLEAIGLREPEEPEPEPEPEEETTMAVTETPETPDTPETPGTTPTEGTTTTTV